MKLGIYNPYLDTLGGGERYSLSIGEFFLKNGWKVEVFWENNEIIDRIQNRFGLDLKKMKVNSRLYKLFSSKGKLFSKFNKTKEYDFIFYVSDGSVPWLFGKKNVILFQAPFHDVGGKDVVNQLKLKNIDKAICYSKFVKNIIDKEFGIDALVLAPFAAEEFKSTKKEKIILSVGRFDNLLHNKRQDILIKVFKEVCQQGLKGWILYLAGGTIHGKEWVKNLKKKASGFPVKIVTNISFKDLINLYGKAEIYWHAAGFEVDEKKQPEKMEHFGLTTLEAMKSRAVPIVFAGGGQKEIVKHKKSGFLWKTEKELIKHTLEIINNKRLFLKLSKETQKRAKDFSKEKFNKMTEKIFGL